MSLKRTVLTIAAMKAANDGAKKLGYSDSTAAWASTGAAVATRKAFKAEDEKRELERRVSQLEQTNQKQPALPNFYNPKCGDYDDYEPRPRSPEPVYEDEDVEPTPYLRLVREFLIAVLPIEFDTGYMEQDKHLIGDGYVLQIIAAGARWEFFEDYTLEVVKEEDGKCVQRGRLDALEKANKMADRVASYIEAHSDFDPGNQSKWMRLDKYPDEGDEGEK